MGHVGAIERATCRAGRLRRRRLACRLRNDTCRRPSQARVRVAARGVRRPRQGSTRAPRRQSLGQPGRVPEIECVDGPSGPSPSAAPRIEPSGPGISASCWRSALKPVASSHVRRELAPGEPRARPACGTSHSSRDATPSCPLGRQSTGNPPPSSCRCDSSSLETRKRYAAGPGAATQSPIHIDDDTYIECARRRCGPRFARQLVIDRLFCTAVDNGRCAVLLSHTLYLRSVAGA